MEEEFNEYKEVVRAAMPTFDDPAQMNAVIDELADLNAVVFHSAVILGISQWDLLEMAYDKVKGRQTDPNYKRTHPHECCGNCDSITRESPTRRERIQKTGGVRRTKRSGSNGGVLC